MQNLEDIIAGCKQYDKKAQRQLYDMYSSTLLGIAYRYCKSVENAEDVLHDGFLKIFTHIDQYLGKGSFEGWMKHIIINTAINYYYTMIKKDILHETVDIYNIDGDDVIADSDEYRFTREELLNAINKMPSGYRAIFNLFAIDGYKHKEIATMLNIAEGTSRSQYKRAVEYLQKKLNEKNKKEK